MLVLEDVSAATQICGHSLTRDAVKDLNRGRTYLRDVAQRHSCPVFRSTERAVQTIVQVWKANGCFPRGAFREKAPRLSTGAP